MEDNHKNKLSLIGLITLAIASVAPTGAMAYSTAATAKVAGVNVPLTFILGGIGIFFVALCFSAMAKYVDDAGAAYAYNQKAFGERTGFITGWIFAFSYIILFVSMPGLLGNFLNVFLSHFGMSVPISISAFVSIILIWVISLFGIKSTSKVAFVTEAIALLILLIIAVVVIAKGGAEGFNAKPFIPQHNNFSGIGQGLIFAFLSYAGFEQISTVAIRSNNPRKTIPRALIGTVLLVAFLFILVTSIEVFGYGTDHINAFANAAAPLDYLSVTYLGVPMAVIMDFAILLSTFASMLGCANAASYMLYALGKNHYLPSKVGNFNLKRNAPVTALNVAMILSIIIYAIFGLPYGYEPIYDGASTLGVLGLLIVYMLVCAGTIKFFKSNSKTEFKFIRHLIVPVLGILVLIYPFISNIYPVPAFPGNLYPYIIIGWVIIGIIISIIHDRKYKNDNK